MFWSRNTRSVRRAAGTLHAAAAHAGRDPRGTSQGRPDVVAREDARLADEDARLAAAGAEEGGARVGRGVLGKRRRGSSDIVKMAMGGPKSARNERTDPTKRLVCRSCRTDRGGYP